MNGAVMTSEWPVVPLKRYLSLQGAVGSTACKQIGLENIESWTGRHVETGSKFEGNGTSFSSGDILFGKLRPYLAKAMIAQERGSAVGDIWVLRPGNDCIPEFALYQLLDPTMIARINSTTTGAKMPRAEWQTVGAFKRPLPPRIVQEKIVAYLDRETTQIDGLIEKKGRFIALLKEMRAAVIAHAVTKGIDPGVAMKDSGVEWLDRVPLHWRVSRLRFHVQVNPSQKEQGSLDAERSTSFFPMEAIGEQGDLDHSNFRRLEDIQTGYSYFGEGDIVVAKVTPCFENGKGAIMSGLLGGFGFGTTEITTLRPDENLDRKFLYLLTSTWAFRKIGVSHMTGAGGLKRVPDDFFRNFSFGLPPLEEQHVIIQHIEHQTARIDGLIAKTTQSIDLLKEKRSALITAAVTGKIDVRSAA